MRDDNCRRRRELLGAHLLGQLESEEGAELRRHLESCPECRAEDAELRAVVNLLDEAKESDLAGSGSAAEAPPPELKEKVVGKVFGGGGGRVPPSVPLAAAAALVVVVIGAAALFAGLSDSGGPPGLGDEEPISFGSPPAGVAIEASVVAHTWGTELLMEAEGLEDGEVYEVSIEREDGSVARGGTLIGVGETQVDCALNAAVLRQNAESITITDSSGEVVARSELESRPPGLYT